MALLAALQGAQCNASGCQVVQLIDLLNGVKSKGKSAALSRLKDQNLCLLHIHRQPTHGTRFLENVELLLKQSPKRGHIISKKQDGQYNPCEHRAVNICSCFLQQLLELTWILTDSGTAALPRLCSCFAGAHLQCPSFQTCYAACQVAGCTVDSSCSCDE